MKNSAPDPDSLSHQILVVLTVVHPLFKGGQLPSYSAVFLFKYVSDRSKYQVALKTVCSAVDSGITSTLSTF